MLQWVRRVFLFNAATGVLVKLFLSFGLPITLLVGMSLTSVPSSQATELVHDPSVTGIVTTIDRTPVANATVELVSSGVSVASAVTGLNGGYRLDAGDGIYSLRVTPPGESLSGVSSLSIELPRRWPVDFVLTPKAAGRLMLTGDVTLSTGIPVAGGNALFAGAGNAISSTGYFTSATAPGTTGTWSLNTRTNTANGGSLVVLASGGPSLTMTQDTYVDFVIPVTTSLVRVTDAAGNPLSNAPIRLNSGGFGLANSRVTLLAGHAAFSANWTASGRTNSDGVAALTRPVITDPTNVNLLVDPPNTSLLPSATVVSLPSAGGELSSSLMARVMPPTAGSTPTPSPSSAATVSPSSTPTASPSATATTEMLSTSGLVAFSDGTKVPGAVVIPLDPKARVNGGNSAGSDGRYVVSKPRGFEGNWSIACRSQASRAIQDELCFALTGGDVRSWENASNVDFIIPMNFYRVRVVDQGGAGIANVKVVASVSGARPDSTARVQVLAGQTPFVGSWRGFDTTGTDGWAQVPGVTMLDDTTVNMSIDSDASSPYSGQVINVAASELSDTVITLGLKAPSIRSVAPTTVSTGDTITVTGSNLLATTRVLLGGISTDFSVVDNTRITLNVPSNAQSGVVEVVSAGGTATGSLPVQVFGPALTIETESLPKGQVGTPYAATFEASGGVAPYQWRILGTRPSGVNLTPAGQLIGTPLRTLSRDLAVAVTDASGQRVIRQIPITIEPRPLTQPAPVRAVGGRGSSQRVSLSWVAPIDDGGNPITGYRIEASTDGGGTWQVVTGDTRSRSTSRSFPYPAGVPAIFRVAAINGLGVGAIDPNVTSPELTAYGPPVAPQDLVVSPGSGQLLVQWTEPANTGGTPIQGYRIRISTNGRSWSTAISNSRSSVLSASVRGKVGQNYYVQVAALNAAGVGAFVTSTSPTMVQ